MTRHEWTLEHVLEQAIVWGFFGVWIALAFVVFSNGVDSAITKHLWFPCFPALSKSFWINLAGGYAWSMMVAHQYTDFLVRARWQGVLAFGEFSDQVDRRTTFAYLWKTIWFFWLPAHTITFSLPPELRVIAAALLAIVLGFLLGLAHRPATAH
jgi:hypothetical protein